MRYVKAPAGWSWGEPNPFAPDGCYDPRWSAFCVRDSEDGEFVTGRGANGLFAVRLGRRVEHLENRLADYLRYESAHGRTVILSFPPDVEVDGLVARALACTPEAGVVRPSDGRVVVHSTSLSAWRRIRADGELRAACLLAAGRHKPPGSVELSEVQQYLRNEPLEYGDYIMLGPLDSTAPEMVVASYSSGRFVLDEDAVYEPGVRLYLDNHRIIRDGLAMRDGLHAMKVHRRLALAPYLLAAIGVADVDPAGAVQAWTLRAFVERANEVFRSRCGLH
jgi:hypothetical protein